MSYFFFSSIKKIALLIILISIILILGSVIFYPKIKSIYTSQNKNNLVLAISSDPKTFNPILVNDASSSQILGILFKGLTKTDPVTGEVTNNLVKEYSVDKSGLIWNFSLYENIKWSDGEKFSAKDVEFTFNKIIYNKEINTPLKSIFYINNKRIKVKAISDFSIQFILPDKFAPFLRALNTPILPKHIFKKIIADDNFTQAWGINAKVSEIVTNGPYKIENYVPGKKIELTKNPFYFKHDEAMKQLPYLDKVIFLILPSHDLELIKFKNGEIDISTLRNQDIQWLKKYAKNDLYSIRSLGPSMGKLFITFNQNKKALNIEQYKIKWFRDSNFRKAILYAINRQQILSTVFMNNGVLQHSAMSPSSGFFFNDNVTKYSYNLNNARELLFKSGFKIQKINNNNILIDKDGNIVEFEVLIATNNLIARQMINLIKMDLKKIGIIINIRELEFNTLVNKLVATKEWEAMLIGLTGNIEPHFGANIWLSNSALHLWNPSQPYPSTEWERAIDKIFNTAATEINPNKRKLMYDKWQLIVSNELPLIYTVIPIRMIGISKKLKNIETSKFVSILDNIERIKKNA